MNPDREPLEVELLVDADKRRVTIAEVQDFRKSISRPTERYDEIDAALDEFIEIDPLVSGTNSRRSDKELTKMLELIDNLPISENGKEGRA